MFGFGVGFGVGEFGSEGYAIQQDASTVTMLGTTEVAAEADVDVIYIPTAELTAESSLSINPAGVVLTRKTIREPLPVLATAKPKTVPGVRIVPPPIASVTYTINPRHHSHRERDPKR